MMATTYDDYPEGAWLAPYDRDLPYELQADDEAAAELMQGESSATCDGCDGALTEWDIQREYDYCNACQADPVAEG
jgi:hypothetical protein